MACYQAARDFALKRKVFDRPVASYQLVQDQLARMLIEITKAQLVGFHLGHMLDDNHIIRHLCDLEAISTLEGTAGVHTLVLCQDITGIGAFH